LLIGALALVPFYRRGGAVAAGLLTWVKVVPLVVAVYYVGRRDWQALRWYGVTFVVLGLVQLPWLDEFVRYSTSALAAYPSPGLSPLALGFYVWIVVAAAFSVATFALARERDAGWLLALLTMLASSPRLLLPSFALLLAHPTLFTPTFEDLEPLPSLPRQDPS
jgi:hypothetical protein